MKKAFLPSLNKDEGYVYNNLILPKTGVRIQAIKSALTFPYGEVTVYDCGEEIGKRPNYLEIWDETENHIIVPREFIDQSKYHHYRFPFNDITPRGFETVDIGDTIILRDEVQEEALRALLRNRSGTLNLSCGRGKTVLALKLSAVLRIPTLVIVNTTALLEQWAEEIDTHLRVSGIGIVQGSKADWEKYPIVLAMVHTLSNRSIEWQYEFRRRFGLVLYDEGHHMSAPTFVRSADLFFGRRYSLTATARRTDGLHPIYQYHLGGVIYKALGQQLIPNTIFHVLSWEISEEEMHNILDVNGEINVPKLRSYLGTLDWRNEIIYEYMRADMLDSRSILALSHIKAHVNTLAEAFPGGAVITGDTAQSDRMDALRNYNPVFGTFQLAREGLNKPELDTLYVATPFGNSNDLQQAWGRIQREYEGKKQPLVRVFEDIITRTDTGEVIGICLGMCRQMRKFLKVLRYPFNRVREQR